MTTFCAAAVLLLAAADPDVAAAAAKDADSLEKLQQEVREMLPEGWVVEISPVQARSSRASLPQIVVRTAEPVYLKFTYEGEPLGGAAREPVPGTYEITFAAAPFHSRERYAEAKQAADEATAARSEFLTRRPRLQAALPKEGWPLHPSALDVRTDEERRLAREYTFLWMRTELPPLPTHHYGELSFIRLLDHYAAPHHDSVRKERDAILSALDRILTRYEVEER